MLKAITAAGKFVKLKDLQGFINKIKNKKNLTTKDKKDIKKGEEILKNTKNLSKLDKDLTPGGLSQEALVRFKKGGAVKKRAKKKKARTGMKVRGTKFKGIF